MVNICQESTMTTGFKTRKQSRRSNLFSQNIYQVTVNGEDGEFFTCEVMADTSAAACAVAEDLARDVVANITYLEIINFH